MAYEAKSQRYDAMKFNRCGKSGLLLPAISLGLWHNFGHVDEFDTSRKIIRKAFDEGVTHFDLANNYGPPPGSAEENFGRVLKLDLMPYRDEIIVSSKAGYYMWPGPYGEWGSKKYIIASCDQSLKRMGLDYVDIFYHHRPDAETPLEESMGALAHLVKQGKALYAGISNYNPEQTKKASELLKSLGVPCLIHQPRYNMFDRWIEDGLLDVLEEQGIGAIAFSPLAQGLLTDRYLTGIPKGSRASKEHGFLKASQITPEKVEKAKKLNAIATNRGQSLAQMALAWNLRDKRITSVLIGASSENQLVNNLETVKNLDFTKEELEQIERILKS
jgi:L-glyceraldehyde 3-phosphate reductase